MSDPTRTNPDPPPDIPALLGEALERHQQGELGQAEMLYQKVLSNSPEDFTATHQLGVIRNQTGRFEEAARLLHQALSLHPRSALAHFNLGIALWGLDRLDEALSHYQYSLVIKPNNPEVLLNFAVALKVLGRPEEALMKLDRLRATGECLPDTLLNRGIVLQDLHRSEEALASFEELLVLDPKHADAHMNRGNVLLGLGRPAEAHASFERALALRPDWANALNNRGICLRELGRREEALASFDRALEVESRHEDALLNRGNILLALGRPAEAMESFDRGLAIRPKNPDALMNRGNALLRLGRAQEALELYDRALLLSPKNAILLGNRSAALLELQRPLEALDCCDQALAIDPEDANAHGNRGAALLSLKRHPEAADSFHRALELNPKNAEVLLNQGTVLHLLGRHGEAIASYRAALAVQPDMAAAHSNLIFILDYIPELGFQEHQEVRKDFFKAQAIHLSTLGTTFPNDRNPARRLVLGYVSADFRNHSAASCFGPVLKHHHKADFKLICYSGVKIEDEWTATFRALADEWRSTLLLSDEDLAAQIRSDGVDILIDLSGHSAGNRLGVFARKPAPIQVTAWGHGGGTGLPMIDYQLTDPVMIPPEVRPLFAEEAYDLPASLPFEAPVFAPEIMEPPVGRKGYLTFGSLNKFTKVTPEAMDLWARILNTVPSAHLLLKDGPFGQADEQARAKAFFAGKGIAAERLDLRGQTSHLQHLEAYHEVDIVLDTFPQNGGLTTWEALWMGVPVITKLGNQPSSRLSGGILHALALGDWVSLDEDGYVALAVQKASDLSALSAFRRDIRRRISESPAGNPELYTEAVEKGYREMWRRWVESSPNLSD